MHLKDSTQASEGQFRCGGKWTMCDRREGGRDGGREGVGVGAEHVTGCANRLLKDRLFCHLHVLMDSVPGPYFFWRAHLCSHTE